MGQGDLLHPMADDLFCPAFLVANVEVLAWMLGAGFPGCQPAPKDLPVGTVCGQLAHPCPFDPVSGGLCQRPLDKIVCDSCAA